MKISRIIATVIFCLTAQPSVLDLVIAGAAAVPAAEAQKWYFFLLIKRCITANYYTSNSNLINLPVTVAVTLRADITLTGSNKNKGRKVHNFES